MTQIEIDYPIGMCVIYKGDIGVVTGYTKNRKSIYLNGWLANQHPVYYANRFDVDEAHLRLQARLDRVLGPGHSLIIK